MPLKIIAWVIILLWCSFPLTAHGQGKGHGVEVRAAMPILSDATSGSTVSASFLVTNTGVNVVTFIEEFQLPPGWIPITPQYLPFFLNIGQQQTRTIAFTVPTNADAGSYQVSYGVRGQSESGIADSQSVTVIVAQSSRPSSGTAPEDQQRKEDESRIREVPGEREKTSVGMAVEFQPAIDGMVDEGSRPFVDAPGQGVEIRAPRDFIREATPGKTITGSFLVTNTTGRTETFVDDVRIPQGWKKLIPQAADPFTLNAGKQRARIIAFSIPPTAPAGSYRITYTAHGSQNIGISGSRSLIVTVTPVHKIEIVVTEKPDFVIAGKPFTVRFRVLNRGNSASRIKMDIRGNMEYPVAPKQTTLTLAVGQSELVTITVTTDDLLKKKETYVLTISALTVNAQGVEVGITKDVVLFILPGAPGPVDLYHRVPAALTMIGSAQDGEYAEQIEFAGGGDIDEEEKKRVDFLFRNPDLQDKNIFGLRDEYRLNYYTDTFDILAGDQGYSLSPLTEQSKYGRGGEVNYRLSTIKASSFYLETPGQSPQLTEGGGYLFYQPIARIGLKANFLHKETDLTSFTPEPTSLFSIPASNAWEVHPGLEENANWAAITPESNNLYSIQTNTAWDKKVVLDLEYGYSDNAGITQTSGDSYNINLKGALKGAGYAIEKTYADPRYFGYSHDLDYTTGTLSFPIYRELTGNISYRSYLNNLEHDPLRGSATDEESYRGGIDLALPTGTHLSLAYEDFQKKDRMALFNQFNFQERLITAGIGQTFKWASLQGYLNSGIIDDNLTGGRNTSVENYSLYASFNPTTWQAYSLYARTGHDFYNDNPQRSKSTGVTATWRYKQADLNLNYQISEYTPSANESTDNPIPENGSSDITFDGRTDVLMSSLNYTSRSNHVISLRSYWISYRKEDGATQETSFLLCYTIPLGIPVRKKKSIGNIQGTVSDAEGKPLQKIVVEVGGLTAMTDKAGEFTFPGFKTGTYYLAAEQGSIGIGKITTEKTPLPVEVKGGETSRVSIRITPSCRLNGRLTLRQSNSERDVRTVTKQGRAGEISLKGLEGMEDKDNSALKLVNILVEISRGEESIRQVTDGEGRFSFYDLRPGIWTVNVAADNLPAYHYVEKESYSIELKSGEEQVIDIQVLPRVRKIQMIDEGQIR
ncbi:MAG: NEW3 domain-containing protein [Desulfosalsimonadaceae bacterium]|nr:NEW3 domain-containing protein [Desulfosalsimonadaceae bacterium]